MRPVIQTLTVTTMLLSFTGPAASSAPEARFLPAPPAGGTATAYPAERGLTPADFPRMIRIAEGVHAYEDLRAPGFTTISLVVIGTKGVLIADGQETVRATRRLLATVARMTRVPVRWYVVGSDHVDHTGGNAALPASVRYVVHPVSRRQLANDAAMSKRTEPAIIVPDHAMQADRETVDVGGREVRVLHLGRAHTGGDLLVHIPDAGVLFMSETFFNRVFPAMRSAHPSAWISTIDAALRMNARVYLPGHGFVEGGARSRAELTEFRRAIQHVIAEGRRLHALGLSPEEAVLRADWGNFGKWMLADTQRVVAIRRVYAEIEGTLSSTGF